MRSPFDTFSLPGPFGGRRGGTDLAAAMAAIMAADEGFWAGEFDPAGNRMFQATTGQTPASAAGQSVGTVIDARLGVTRDGLVWTGLGAEMVPNGTFDDATGWTLGGSSAINGGTLNVVSTGNNFISSVDSPLSGLYRVAYDITAVTGTGNQVRFTVASGTLDPVTGLFRNTVGVYQELLLFTTVATLRLSGGASTANCRVDNFSVRRIPGNHGRQGTAASRPTLQQTGGGLWYLSNDGADSLPATLPSGTYTRVTVDTAGNVVTTTGLSGGGAVEAAPTSVSQLVDCAIRRDLTGDDLATVQAYMASLV